MTKKKREKRKNNAFRETKKEREKKNVQQLTFDLYARDYRRSMISGSYAINGTGKGVQT